MWGRQLAVIPI